jgi:hypothetical protein
MNALRPLCFSHVIFGGFTDGVEERTGAAGYGQGIQGGGQFFPRVGELLEKLDLYIEVHDEGEILVFQHPVEEDIARTALGLQDVLLAPAGIDQKTEGQGQLRIL